MNIRTQGKKRFPSEFDRSEDKIIVVETNLDESLHALFGHWINNGFHQRDFVSLIDHVSKSKLFDWRIKEKWERETGVEHESELKADSSAPKLERIKELSQQKKERIRFFDDDDIIDHRASKFCYIAFAQIESCLDKWVRAGYYIEDFSLAAQNVAVEIIYEYGLCKSLGGMGGGKDEEEFLCQPYRDTPSKSISKRAP